MIDGEYQGIETIKYLTAGRLIELLSTVPPECRVYCNRTRNMSIESPDGERALGMINFLLEGEIEGWE